MTKSKLEKLKKRLDKLEKQVSRLSNDVTMNQCTLILLEKKVREKHELSLDLAIDYLKLQQAEKAYDLVHKDSHGFIETCHKNVILKWPP